jgi:hypothetical protein
LDSAKTDFLRYVKTEAKRVRLARTGTYLNSLASRKGLLV